MKDDVPLLQKAGRRQEFEKVTKLKPQKEEEETVAGLSLSKVYEQEDQHCV